MGFSAAFDSSRVAARRAAAGGSDEVLVMPDFELTEISEAFPEAEAQTTSIPSPDVAQDIDFSVFAAALNETPGEHAAVDPSSADFVLDLELPDLEPVSIDLFDSGSLMLEAAAQADHNSSGIDVTEAGQDCEDDRDASVSLWQRLAPLLLLLRQAHSEQKAVVWGV